MPEQPAAKVGASAPTHEGAGVTRLSTAPSPSVHPFVVIRADGHPFHFNDEGSLADAEEMVARLNAVVHEYLPWNQGFFGPFAGVEMRELDPDA